MSGSGTRGFPGITGPTSPTGRTGPTGVPEIPKYNNIPDYIIDRGRKYIRENKILNCAYANVIADIKDDENNLLPNQYYLNGLLDMYIILTEDKYVRSRVFENLPGEIVDPMNYDYAGNYRSKGETGE
ncbi:MAG: hypothetical protein LBK23_01340 [Oscillospiraceae bacterium]|jgi:hypothetical protein|nr:hypothetical protein [Oscillospiraceae bacterium]